MSHNEIPEAQASVNYDPTENLPEGIVISVSERNVGANNSATKRQQTANNLALSTTAPVISPISSERSLSSLSSTRNINPDLIPNELSTRNFLTRHNWPMGYQNFLLSECFHIMHQPYISLHVVF